MVDELLSRGIDAVSATEPHMDSTTPQGRPLRNIFASVTEYERELVRERVKAGLANVRAKGKVLGQRPRQFRGASPGLFEKHSEIALCNIV